MARLLTEDDIVEKLRNEIRYGVTQAMLAKKIGIRKSYMSCVLSGKRGIGDAILKYYELEVVYRYKEQQK